MSVKIADKVTAKCLHCDEVHNWVVAATMDAQDGSPHRIRIDRVGDGPDCGCFRQVVKPESVELK